VHLQAPPNLSDDFGRLLDAGIDDWGGVSPVTADHVNPERPWPARDRLADVTEAAGFELAPRLTIYPEFATARALGPPDLAFAVQDRSDAEGSPETTPGRCTPRRSARCATWATAPRWSSWAGAPRSGTSGLDTDPPHAGPRPGTGHRPGGEVLDAVRRGEVPDEDQITTLFSARGREVAAVAGLADELRREAVGDEVTWVANRNINYTNVCTFKCRFCGFSKGPRSLNLRGTPYLLTLDDIAERAAEAGRSAPPRCASRAASTPTSTATTTSTSPER
jgi:FO synthase